MISRRSWFYFLLITSLTSIGIATVFPLNFVLPESLSWLTDKSFICRLGLSYETQQYQAFVGFHYRSTQPKNSQRFQNFCQSIRVRFGCLKILMSHWKSLKTTCNLVDN